MVNSGIQDVQRSQSPLLRAVMPELDAVRGLAVLMVLFYHGLYWGLDLAQYPRVVRIVLSGMWLGRLGVNLFFVLSGFLITGLLVDSKSHASYYSRFYIRRALRILPAYFLTLAILVALSYAPWTFIVLSLAYLSNLTPLFGVPIAYPVLWSLAVEEHFYFLWPVVVRKLSVTMLLALCSGIIVLSPVSRALSFHLSAHNGVASFVCNEYTWNSIDGLASGALLAIWLRQAAPDRKTIWKATWLLFCCALILEVLGLPWGIWTRQRLFGAALQVSPWHLVFVALLSLFLLLGSSPWSKAVQSPVLRFFGDISYGLYLYHLMVFAGIDYLAKQRHISWIGKERLVPLLTRFVLSAGLAVGIAWVSRITLEDYFLSFKKRWTS